MNGFAPYSPGHQPGTATTAEIRAAVSGDITAMLSVQAGSGRASPTAASFEAATNDDARLVVVALLDGVLVGWGMTHYFAGGDGTAPAGHYLGGVTVAPSWRRRGIGAALTQARLDWIWQRADTAWYVVNPANRASIALHSRWGFTEVARAAKFHTTEFTGGVGLLMRARYPQAEQD
ncbi:MAG: GNAT family N-acetyltransferase [Specibacter sp.]